VTRRIGAGTLIVLALLAVGAGTALAADQNTVEREGVDPCY
jgi:hypothetical protein